MPRILLIILLLGGMYFCYSQSTAPPSNSISVEEVVRLAHAGVSDEIIITKIKKAGKSFDLSAEEILELKKKGVSDDVTKMLMDPSQPYAPVSPAAMSASASAGKPAAAVTDPVGSKVPSMSGLYYSPDAARVDFIPLSLKPLTAAAGGGLSGFLKKGGVDGYLAGSKAALRLSATQPILYLRLPEKNAIEDVILLSLTQKSDRREVSFGSKPMKPIFPIEAIRPFEVKELGADLFRLTPATLKPGEYVLLLLGSGDDKKGILGKGWEFSVEVQSK